jgi:hypothetical protein
VTKTVIAYTYRRGDLPATSKIAVQGPVYMDDDGTAPWVQAVRRLARNAAEYGRTDTALTAERVDAPAWWND